MDYTTLSIKINIYTSKDQFIKAMTNLKYFLSSLLHFRHIPLKLTYYVNNFGSLYLIPRVFYRLILKGKLNTTKDKEYIENRVNYYMKKEGKFKLSEKALQINQFKRKEHSSVYFLDTMNILKYFNPLNKVDFEFGDVITIPSTPSIVKSRPIKKGNENNVLLKLNKIRHFNFIDDWIDYKDKKNMLVARGNVFVNHTNRIYFLEKFANHPMCNVGSVNLRKDVSNGNWLKSKMSIEEQLHYKFIYCWEGNDVATNLKWVMSSNSLAVMPTPQFETWFMEGTLIPDHHYVHVKDDLSDLEEKLNYYSNNIEEAQKIIKNANDYVAQFENESRETTIQLQVMQKYFEGVEK